MTAEFNVGESGWVPVCRLEERTIPCPICFEKREVVLILGNGDQVTMPCGYCGKGWNDPCGVVVEHLFRVDADPFTVERKTIAEDATGQTYEYVSTLHGRADGDRIFKTREEALARAMEEKAEKERTENRAPRGLTLRRLNRETVRRLKGEARKLDWTPEDVAEEVVRAWAEGLDELPTSYDGIDTTPGRVYKTRKSQMALKGNPE